MLISILFSTMKGNHVIIAKDCDSALITYAGLKALDWLDKPRNFSAYDVATGAELDIEHGFQYKALVEHQKGRKP